MLLRIRNTHPESKFALRFRHRDETVRASIPHDGSLTLFNQDPATFEGSELHQLIEREPHLRFEWIDDK